MRIKFTNIGNPLRVDYPVLIVKVNKSPPPRPYSVTNFPTHLTKKVTAKHGIYQTRKRIFFFEGIKKFFKNNVLV